MPKENNLKYNGYIGTIQYDDDNEHYFGKVAGISDKIIYEGLTIEELEVDFRESIDEYLEFCKEIGKEPDL